MLSKLNFHYVAGFDIEYEEEFECQNGSDCCDNDYCRCGVIFNANVTKVGSAENIVKHIESALDYEKLNAIEHYGVERLASFHKVWDKDRYEVGVCGGYYGQEIDGIYLSDAASLEAKINEFLALKTNRDRIEFLLTEEYGFVHERVQNKTWKVDVVEKDKIHFGQSEYYRHVNENLLKDYFDYNFPRGICLKEDGVYKVMDGYHRLTACKDDIVEIIVGS